MPTVFLQNYGSCVLKKCVTFLLEFLVWYKQMPRALDFELFLSFPQKMDANHLENEKNSAVFPGDMPTNVSSERSDVSTPTFETYILGRDHTLFGKDWTKH